MDLIRHPAFLTTTLLHCLLASSLPQYDWSQNSDTYKSYIPEGGSLRTIYSDKVLDHRTSVTPAYGVKSNWQHKPSLENPEPIVRNLLNYYVPGMNYDSVRRNQLPGNTQYSTYKPEALSRVLNAADFDYPPSTPGVHYAEHQVENTHYNLEPPKLVMIQPKNHGYSTSPGLHGEEDTFRPTSHQSVLPLGARSTNFEYPSTNPHYINGYPRREFQYSLKPGYPGTVDVEPTKPDPYSKPGVDGKKTIDLPPIPTSPMSARRQMEIVLMNTVAGTPGGSTALLDSVRAT